MISKFVIYDKIKWHTEKGMNFKEAKKHLLLIFDFLYNNGLLSAEGIEIYEEEGITRDFSLNEDLLSARGIKFLNNNYDNYLLAVKMLGIEQAFINLKNEFKII